MALLTRLIIICLNLCSSPINTAGIFSSISYNNSIGLPAALFSKIILRALIITLGLYLPSTMSILPDSIFEKSKISLIIVKSASPDTLILLRYSTVSLECSPLKRTSVIPTIAFIGVLISCDILDKKLDFALLAASAFSFSISAF